MHHIVYWYHNIYIAICIVSPVVWQYTTLLVIYFFRWNLLILYLLLQDLENQMDVAEKRRLTLLKDFLGIWGNSYVRSIGSICRYSLRENLQTAVFHQVEDPYNQEGAPEKYTTILHGCRFHRLYRHNTKMCVHDIIIIVVIISWKWVSGNSLSCIFDAFRQRGMNYASPFLHCYLTSILMSCTCIWVFVNCSWSILCQNSW